MLEAGVKKKPDIWGGVEGVFIVLVRCLGSVEEKIWKQQIQGEGGNSGFVWLSPPSTFPLHQSISPPSERRVQRDSAAGNREAPQRCLPASWCNCYFLFGHWTEESCRRSGSPVPFALSCRVKFFPGRMSIRWQAPRETSQWQSSWRETLLLGPTSVRGAARGTPQVSRPAGLWSPSTVIPGCLLRAGRRVTVTWS